MKIGILTQPLHNNYGGLLQAYALQRILRDKGYDVYVIDISGPKSTYFRIFASILKRFILKYLFRKNEIKKIYVYRPSQTEKEIVSKNTDYFKRKYISITNKKYSSYELTKLNSENFDAFIVGSDQVWRPKYTANIFNYFLNFVDGNIIKLSYAASFGVDNWEFSQSDTAKCSALAKEFDGISVREDSGIDLCRKYLGVDSLHVLDPTMLLSVQHYEGLINNEDEPMSDGDLMIYILDKSSQKEGLIKKVAKELSLKPFTVMQKVELTEETRSSIDECVFPPVTKWIKGFQDSKFVVTDSFHGTVFSILFNKPFISIGNAGRGLSRFESLLKKFGLENRLVTNYKDINSELINSQIDWSKVNNVLGKERIKSTEFLTSHLE